MRRTIAATTVVGLMSLAAANASADKGGVPHEGSNGKGRQEQGAPPAANQQTAPAPARRTPPPRKQEEPKKKHKHAKVEHARKAPVAKHAPAAAPAPARPHGQPKVTICHHTGSNSHPWVQITIAQPAVKAHAKHGDLIPAPSGGCPAAAAAPQKAASKAPAGAKSHEKVTICHRTGSESNPWVQITVAEPAVKAHAKHGDLIPVPSGGCPAPEAATLPAAIVTPTSGPTVAADSVTAPVRAEAQPALPDGGLGPVTIVRRATTRGAVLAETASRSASAKPRGAVLAETVSAPTAAAAEPASGSGLPFTGWPAWLVVMIGVGALLAGFALRRAHATHA